MNNAPLASAIASLCVAAITSLWGVLLLLRGKTGLSPGPLVLCAVAGLLVGELRGPTDWPGTL